LLTAHTLDRTAFIKLSFLYLPIFISEISLHTPPGHDRKGEICCDWCSSAYRSELIISCVRACHAFLDEFLALPDEIIRMLNVAESELSGRFPLTRR